MAEIKEQNTNSKVVKKKSRLKGILYLILILVLLVIIGIGYYKIKQLVGKYKSNVVTLSSTADDKDSKDGTDSINTSLLNEYLQKQQDFQKEVSQKILNLSKQINSNSNSNNTSADNKSIKDAAEIAQLKAEITALNSKKTYIDNFALTYNLIIALKGNAPFLNELELFKNSSLSNKYTSDVLAVYNVAATGIPSSYDLATTLSLLTPQIKTANYKLNTSTWGKIKYYLSFLIVVQKNNDFIADNASLDSILYNTKLLLLNNNTEAALNLVNNSYLCRLAPVVNWCQDLKDRGKANAFALSLQQYLLNSQTVDNK